MFSAAEINKLYKYNARALDSNAKRERILAKTPEEIHIPERAVIAQEFKAPLWDFMKIREELLRIREQDGTV